MGKWGIVIAVAMLLGLAGGARAQAPSGGNGMRFVPVDTTRNLATPLPKVNIPQPNLSLSDRVHNFFASFVPFVNKRQPTLPGPQGPTTTLPKGLQSQLPKPQQPTTTGLNLPTIPPAVSGTIR